ncbi:MAG: hypothetical protein LIP03_10310, partial [Bacteroidales bacterium]|nr:hypothetical protein [Bacteroidales bacterium]
MQRLKKLGKAPAIAQFQLINIFPFIPLKGDLQLCAEARLAHSDLAGHSFVQLFIHRVLAFELGDEALHRA